MINTVNGLIIVFLLISIWWMYKQYRRFRFAKIAGLMSSSMGYSVGIARIAQLRATHMNVLVKSVSIAQAFLDINKNALAAYENSYDDIAGKYKFLARRVF